jgi:lipid-A-disaccharide synthase
MKPKTFMLIAGEASGDLLAAELVPALRARLVKAGAAPTADGQPLRTALTPRFFGAGGPHMAKAGVELAFDLTAHSVIGFSEVLKKYFEFRRLFNQLLKLALDRQPDVIMGVDYGGFNLRFAQAIKRIVRRRRNEFNNWNPRFVQYVSPQVWASRPWRAYQLAADCDLLLSIFPFEPGVVCVAFAPVAGGVCRPSPGGTDEDALRGEGEGGGAGRATGVAARQPAG